MAKEGVGRAGEDSQSLREMSPAILRRGRSVWASPFLHPPISLQCLALLKPSRSQGDAARGDEHSGGGAPHRKNKERMPANRLRSCHVGCCGLEGFTTDGIIRVFHAIYPFLYLPLPHLGGSRIRVSADLSSWCSSNSAMNESQRPPQ